MAPKVAASQPAKRAPKAAGNKTVKLGSTQPLTLLGTGPNVKGGTAAKKRFDPLTAFRSTPTPTPPPPPSDTPSGSQQKLKRPANANVPTLKDPRVGKKAKGKATCDQLWVDLHEPTTEAELAVHIKKVEDVRRWITEAFDGGRLKKFRRILTLTGPAGTGKTSTLKVLANEMDFEIVEWRSAISQAAPAWGNDSPSYSSYDPESESAYNQFETFFNRAACCQNLAFSDPSSSRRSVQPKRQLILLEDLPNILHQKTQSSFHDCLRAFVNTPAGDRVVPVVIVISDTGIRGEARDERLASGGGWGKEREQTVDVRSVVPKELLHGPYVTQIMFNPIAPTLMRKALTSMLAQASRVGDFSSPSKQVVDVVIESSNGDIRSAIMALQFACLAKGSSGNKRSGTAMVTEAITRREQSLALFHLIGKVLYNKRKGDPSSSSATAKDLQKERELDAQLHDPPPLPLFLEHENRRASRVDVNTIYTDSPIDSSLFSLYVHQNYQQFCDDVDEIHGVAEWLSWVDSSGGEAWYQANPHQFHLVALGTLHSLPSPVQRRSQKIFKPEFFDVLQKERDARDGVRLTREWIVAEDIRTNPAGRRVAAWSSSEVILELPSILKQRDRAINHDLRPPRAHRLFSSPVYVKGTGSPKTAQVGEKDAVDESEAGVDEGDADEGREGVSLQEEVGGGWLVDDEIEDFD